MDGLRVLVCLTYTAIYMILPNIPAHGSFSESPENVG